ncbi:MAG: MBL fold metallo-hydrolase [bacterium]|nr:MBL fold metallo-hydrolase [bacterium]
MSTDNNRNNHPWEKIKVRDNIFQYYFDDAAKVGPNSIFVCIDGDRKKALLIDTAYPEYSQKVKTDLEEMGIEPEVVVLSHYHPDHSSGAVHFKNCRIYASRLYEDNHFNAQRWEPDLTFLHPTDLLDDGDTLTFGPFHIKFIYAPGHCNCLLMSMINDDVMHIGDLLMFDSTGKPTLPYISMGGGFKRHIASLERLRTLPYNSLMIPHGHIQNDREKINGVIEGWIHYLKRMLESNGELPLAECVKGDLSGYGGHEYHQINVMGLVMET